MTGTSFASILFLLSIVILVNSVSAHPRSKKFFKFIPSVFWIYFLPIVFSALGLVDPKNQVFTILPSILLPAALLLLLLSSDVKGIIKCGRPALTMMFAGSLGIMVATPLVFFFFKDLVGPQFWSGFGALSGSWIGGSANMIAVKESINTPEPVFLPMVIVDTVVPYVWMGLLVGMAGLQPLFDKWNRADRSVIDKMALKHFSAPVAAPRAHGNCAGVLLSAEITVVTVVGVVVSKFLAGLLPEIKDMISTYAWMIIIVSAMGVFLSCTPVKKLENFGASKIGYFLLYLVLASIGARAGVVNVGPVLFLILAGFLIVFFHAGVLFLTARLIRAPLFLVAVSSQANIGGVASAPIVASIYQPGLASIGLLLAICGNITGTYLGIITSQVCRFVAEKL